MEAAAANLTPVVLELGGKDAFIVCEDADLDQVNLVVPVSCLPLLAAFVLLLRGKDAFIVCEEAHLDRVGLVVPVSCLLSPVDLFGAVRGARTYACCRLPLLGLSHNPRLRPTYSAAAAAAARLRPNWPCCLTHPPQQPPNPAAPPTPTHPPSGAAHRAARRLPVVRPELRGRGAVHRAGAGV